VSLRPLTIAEIERVAEVLDALRAWDATELEAQVAKARALDLLDREIGVQRVVGQVATWVAPLRLLPHTALHMPAALRMLQDRGLTDPEIAEHDLRTLAGLVPVVGRSLSAQDAARVARMCGEAACEAIAAEPRRALEIAKGEVGHERIAGAAWVRSFGGG